MTQRFHRLRPPRRDQKPIYQLALRKDYQRVPLNPDYGLSRANKVKTVCALTDFVSVHFHLHLDPLRKEEYDPHVLIKSRTQVIEVFQPHLWTLYLKHGLGERHAVVHLKHLPSLWPKLLSDRECLRIGTLQLLIELIAHDQMTD
jgi:hypothetical protein